MKFANFIVNKESYKDCNHIGQRMSECLDGFVSAVKALFPISTQTYHQEGKTKESAACLERKNKNLTFSIYFLLFILYIEKKCFAECV